MLLKESLSRCQHCSKGSQVPGPSLSHVWPLFLDCFLFLFFSSSSCCLIFLCFSEVSQGESVGVCTGLMPGLPGPSPSLPFPHLTLLPSRSPAYPPLPTHKHPLSQLVNKLLFLVFYFGKCLNIDTNRRPSIMSLYTYTRFNHHPLMATLFSSITACVCLHPQHLNLISSLVNKEREKKHKSADATLWAELPANRGNYSAKSLEKTLMLGWIGGGRRRG